MKLEKQENLRAAVIGKDGRTSAIADRLAASPRISGTIELLSSGKAQSREALVSEVLRHAESIRPDFVVVGPEEPLAWAIVDELERVGIACVGPRAELARLEASKSFTRRLLAKHRIPGNPQFQVFEELDGVRDYLASLREFVVKPDGLTGGKGVRVSGDHLHSISEAVAYCREILESRPPVIIEEKLDGEEFSLQSFSDGMHVVHSIPVQDHKRSEPGDAGPNTGGMGSYSDADHLLPFLDADALTQARDINARVVRALAEEFGPENTYKGILFGGFMLTRDGVRVLEYNARFGDPEALNVLSLLDTDFAELCLGIINGNLDETPVRFRRSATVCKYIVPSGYPSRSTGGVADLSEVPHDSEHLRTFLAAVDPLGPKRNRQFTLTGSRAIAFVGIGQSLSEANEHAERACSFIRGPVRYRSDIGTEELIDKRRLHMESVRHRLAV